MKKITKSVVALVIVIVIALSNGGFTAIFAENGSEKVTVKLDGRVISFPDAQPYIDENDRTLVPVRFITENMGGTVEWEETAETVTMLFTDKEVILKIGEYKAYVIMDKSARVMKLDTCAILKEDRTFVPLRFVSEVIGARVSWNDDTWTVDIEYNTSETPEPTISPIVTPDSTPVATPRPVETPIATPSPVVTPKPAATPVLLKIDLNEDPMFQQLAAIDNFTSASGQNAPFYDFIYAEENPYNNNNINAVLDVLYNQGDTGRKNTKKASFAVAKFDEKNMERFKQVLSLIIPDAKIEIYELATQYFGGKTETFYGYICDGKYKVYIKPYNKPQYPKEQQGAYIDVTNGGQ